MYFFIYVYFDAPLHKMSAYKEDHIHLQN